MPGGISHCCSFYHQQRIKENSKQRKVPSSQVGRLWHFGGMHEKLATLCIRSHLYPGVCARPGREDGYGRPWRSCYEDGGAWEFRIGSSSSHSRTRPLLWPTLMHGPELLFVFGS